MKKRPRPHSVKEPIPATNRLRRAVAFLAGISLLLLVFLGAGCAHPESEIPSAQAVPSDPTLLRVGITPSLPPMIFKEGGHYAGVEADLAQDLAAHLGRTVRFVELPWEKQIDALLGGRTDIIMSSMTVTTPRQMRINFSKAYMGSGQAALVRREEAARYRLFLFKDKFRLGVQKGTTGDYFAQQYMQNARRIPMDNAQAGADQLARKKIDLLIHDAPIIWWLASVNENAGLTVLPDLLTNESLAWGLRKEDTALLESVNGYLEEAAQQGRLQAVISRWIPRFSP